MMGRGELTDEIKDVSVLRIGREISQEELRFIPYIQYLMVNGQKLDPNKISSVERKIWTNWKKEGFVDGGMTGMKVSQKFWTLMLEVLWFGYVGDAKLDAESGGSEQNG